MRQEPGHRPPGAFRQTDGSVLWRVWAPRSENVSLVTFSHDGSRQAAMTPEGHGYFVHQRPDVSAGSRYSLKLSDGREYPDPASRWQPEGVHRPSAVFFPDAYRWSDEAWRGHGREDLVIYELHVGVFTPEGSFGAIIPRLPQLASLGVTAIEVMPIAQFPGDRNWGYDGVHPYAVQNSYGGPLAFQQFVDAAHCNGLGVIVDVVYNHLGPEGNYLARFGPYFTDRYHTPWGEAVNLDGPDSDAVRWFFIHNACAWVRDFHVDGLRLDAIHAIYDCGPRPILAEIKAAVQEQAARQHRRVHVIAEDNRNDVRVVSPMALGGHGLDAVWSDDFHHSVHALLTGQRDGYYQDFGRPGDLAKSLNEVFVYDGCYSAFRRRRHGSRAGTLDRTHFVVCVQNHDQVGNRAKGDRFGAILPPPTQRLACGLLLLSPCVPLMFMGEEYGETAPFPFFCSFDDPQLIAAVRHGRREEFAGLRFAWGAEILDPQAPETFASAKLHWQWPEGSRQSQLRQLYQDLLTARRRWPPLRDRHHTTATIAGGPDAADGDGRNAVLLVERGHEKELLAVANLSVTPAACPPLELAGRRFVLSTENVQYGGYRSADQPLEQLYPYEMLLYARS